MGDTQVRTQKKERVIDLQDYREWVDEGRYHNKKHFIEILLYQTCALILIMFLIFFIYRRDFTPIEGLLSIIGFILICFGTLIGYGVGNNLQQNRFNGAILKEIALRSKIVDSGKDKWKEKFEKIRGMY